MQGIARLLTQAIACVLCLGESLAQTGNTVNGLSGYVFVPNAAIAPRGTVTFDYSPSVPGADRSDGHNLSLLFGLHPNIEVSGRVAANTLQCKMYAEPNCGMRDLSASGKVSFDLSWVSPSPLFRSLRFAAGATDVGGAATSFHSKFVVASYVASRFEVSVGHGRTVEGISRHMPLDGPFAGGAFSIFPWARVHLEATRDHSAAGLRLSDERLLSRLGFPEGSGLYVQMNKSLAASIRELPQPHLSVGLRIPLDTTGSVPKSQRLTRSGSAEVVAEPPRIKPARVLNTVSPFQSDAIHAVDAVVRRDSALVDSERSESMVTAVHSEPALKGAASEHTQLLQFAALLAKGGFSDISIGFTGDRTGIVLSVNNIGFTHGELDALGAGLGHLAFKNPVKSGRYRFVLNRWNLPILWVEGDLDCLRGWLLGDPSCNEANAIQLHFHDPDTQRKSKLEGHGSDVNWLIRKHRPAWEKLRLHLGPSSHYAFATEFGIWDYSVAVVMNPWLHLWQGAVIEGVRQIHINQSEDYDPGGIFSFWKMRTGNGRMMLHQAFTQTSLLPSPIGGKLSGRLSIGQPFPEWLGGGGEIRWDSQNGQHALTFASHRYIYQGDLPGYLPGQPSTFTYRFMPPNSDWQFETTYGRWWNRDHSLSVASRHWFGDMNVGFFLQSYRDTRPLWFGGKEVSFAGIELSFPLSLRREIHTGSLPFDVRGQPRYGVGLATTVGRKDNAFVGAGGYPLYAHLGVGSGVPFATGAILKDFDRLGPAYTPYHLSRVRYAFDRWVKPELSGSD